MPKPRILIADDEPNLSELVRLSFQKKQHFDVLVENRSALALSATRSFRPHMILLDVDMPGKDGGDVSHELQADPALRSVPVLFCTSLISRAEAGEHEVLRAGQHFLAKPINQKVLVAAVDRMLAGTVCAA